MQPISSVVVVGNVSMIFTSSQISQMYLTDAPRVNKLHCDASPVCLGSDAAAAAANRYFPRSRHRFMALRQFPFHFPFHFSFCRNISHFLTLLATSAPPPPPSLNRLPPLPDCLFALSAALLFRSKKSYSNIASH